MALPTKQKSLVSVLALSALGACSYFLFFAESSIAGKQVRFADTSGRAQRDDAVEDAPPPRRIFNRKVVQPDSGSRRKVIDRVAPPNQGRKRRDESRRAVRARPKKPTPAA